PAPVRAVCQGLVPVQDEGAGPESRQGLGPVSGERHGPVTRQSTQFLVTESPLIIPLPAEQVWLIRGPAWPVVALPLIVQHSDNLVDLALFPVVVRHWTHLGNVEAMFCRGLALFGEFSRRVGLVLLPFIVLGPLSGLPGVVSRKAAAAEQR